MKRLKMLLGTAALASSACAADVVSMGYDEPVVNQGTMPVGPVQMCTGGCPYGECDNSEFFTDVDCDDVYPGPIDENSLFCHPGENVSYCIDIGPDQFITDTWVVHCGGGVATAEQCARGCESFNNGAECH